MACNSLYLPSYSTSIMNSDMVTLIKIMKFTINFYSVSGIKRHENKN